MRRIMKGGDHLNILSMGKLLRVTAILTSDSDANDYMAKHDDQAVVAVFEPFVFLANKYDAGLGR